jgi:hypothetical protein
MIELVAILAFIIACQRLRRAAREPRRVDVHVYHHFGDGGPGEPVFFEEPEDPNGNIVPFRRAIRTRRRADNRWRDMVRTRRNASRDTTNNALI